MIYYQPLLTCSFCQQLLRPEQASLIEGLGHWVRCPRCTLLSVQSSAQAEPIFWSVVQWLQQQDVHLHTRHLRIELRSVRQLSDFLGQSDTRDVLGATLQTTYYSHRQVVKVQVEGVAILRGLPALMFHGVTIHELGHAWLATSHITELPPWGAEGFCELLAHRFYCQVASEESLRYAARIENNRDPIYGDGFRRLYHLAARVGFQNLLKTLRKTKALPVL